MTTDINELFDQIQKLRAKGKDDEAKELLLQRFQELPEDVRTAIMFEMFSDGVEQHADALETIRNLQDQGLTAAQIIAARKD